MNLIQLIRLIEELVFEVMSWFIMIPKTFAKLISSPEWGPDYVMAELSRPLDQRFDDYVSPIILWLVLAVLPYFAAIKPLAAFLPGDFNQQLLLVALFLAAGPLGFATAVVASRNETLSKSNLKAPFHVQCYCFTPGLLLSLPAVILTVRSENTGASPYSFAYGVSVGMALLWLFIAEVVALRRQLGVTWTRAGLLFFPFLFASYMVAWAVLSALAILVTATTYVVEGG